MSNPIKDALSLTRTAKDVLIVLDMATSGKSMLEVDHGRTSHVVTAKGDEVKTAFVVVEARSLIPSNTTDGRINPEYPQELQPRDRTRKSSILQINKMARSLRPAQLADSGLSSHGAPIIGPDLVVESGNGRTLSIIRAYADGNADNYRDHIVDNAELYGLNRRMVASMREPVLVRVRLDAVDRAQFARDSNISDLQGMAPTEQARVDAEELDEKLMALFSPSEGGDLLAASNRPFIQAFLARMGSEQAAGYLTADGRPTKQVIDRVQAAIFAKAYKSESLLRLAVEEPDPEIRNILTALNVAAPSFVQMGYLSGEVHKQATDAVSEATGLNKNLDDAALSALVDATTVVREAKASGQDVREYLSQQGLFGDTSPEVAVLARFIADNNRSAKRMGEAFKAMADEICAELQHQGAAMGDMFGAEPMDLIGLLARVNDRLMDGAGPAQQVAMFEGVNSAAILQARRAVSTEPTDAQKESGNYRKGHVVYHGLPIAIENPKGSFRTGVDDSGTAWESQMHHDYGYIKGTVGADGDQVDVFIGDDHDSERVFIVNQINPDSGEFDEHKVMLGFGDVESARVGYLACYEAGWRGLGSVVPMDLDELKSWLRTGQLGKPAAGGEAGQSLMLESSTDMSDIERAVARVKDTNSILRVLDYATDPGGRGQAAFDALYMGAIRDMVTARTAQEADRAFEAISAATDLRGLRFPPGIEVAHWFPESFHATKITLERFCYAARVKAAVLNARESKTSGDQGQLDALKFRFDYALMALNRMPKDTVSELWSWLMGEEWDGSKIEREFMSPSLIALTDDIADLEAQIRALPVMVFDPVGSLSEAVSRDLAGGRAEREAMELSAVKSYLKMNPAQAALFSEAVNRTLDKLQSKEVNTSTASPTKTASIILQVEMQLLADRIENVEAGAYQKSDRSQSAYDDYKKKHSAGFKAATGVLAVLTKLVNEALKPKAANTELKALVEAVISSSPMSEQEAAAMAAATPIRITEARLAAGYSMDKLKVDLAEFYRVAAGRVEIPTIIRRKKRASAIRAKRELNSGDQLDKRVLWHELGHFVEFSNPELLNLVRQLLRRRYDLIKDDRPIKPLMELNPERGYDPEEVAIDDGFFDYYVGKLYGATVPELVTSTEVLSMGLESLTSDAGMARLQRDPEHFALTLAAVKYLHNIKKLGADNANP